jgi:putative tryptophan/tyrosine transport system substrate-binding protein
MRKREFISLLGGAVAGWPLVGRAQQPPMPVIGLLSAGTRESAAQVASPAFHKGLSEAGFTEGRNVAIEYRYADGQYDRLPAMAIELAQRQVVAMVASPTPAALAAKAVTIELPIIFAVADDPVKLGLVGSLARPGGNVTGVNFLLSNLVAKQLGLLHELIPSTTQFGLLINPTNQNAKDVKSEMNNAAAAMGANVTIAQAHDSREIEAAFKTLVEAKIEALVVGTDPFFYTRRVQLALLAAHYNLPTIFNVREYAEAGGLLSYGTSLAEAFRLTGVYMGRVLRGEKPADLPVIQSTKFDFLINLATARVLGLGVPPTLLARADEVIE